VKRWLCIAALLLGCVGGDAQRPTLRVGTSGDYAPFSTRDASGRRGGLDVELVRAYARERGLAIRWVPLRWTELERDFQAGRFDLVASGVTVRPERSLAGRFSVPVASSGLVLLAREGAPPPQRRGTRLVVNAGGHLERTARRLFPEAALLPITRNAAVREALLDGKADAAVSDTLEAPGWLAGTRGLRTLGPYTRDWKAWWLPAADSARARDLDAWLLAREASGALGALRARQLPEGAREASATPLVALGAALEERLALMPLVAEAKRASGAPVRVPAQERAVLETARTDVREAAARLGLPAPDAAATDALFGALLDAAREVQERTLAGPASGAPPVDLDGTLRPALARISERIAALWLLLPRGLAAGDVKGALEGIEERSVSAATRDRVARALLARH
jgi:cyclohexadienyl dehydratase